MKAGDLIWVAEHQWQGGYKDPVQVSIDRVGREYFYIGRDKYRIDNLKHVTEGSYQNLLFLDIQVWYDRQERDLLSNQIRRFFSNWGEIKLSVPQLREIKKIIDDNTAST